MEAITQWFVATANGTSYPAENSIVMSGQTITATTNIYSSVIFPGLTVTQLTPGEAITLVPPSFTPLSLSKVVDNKDWLATGPQFNEEGGFMYSSS